MQPWTANLIGLALGFAIGGAGLSIVLSANQDTPAPIPSAEPQPVPKPPAPLPRVNPPKFQPIELPRIIPDPAPLPQADSLPNIIYPEPGQGAHKPGTGATGTGFFVASDATLITAAHVVADCRQTRIVSSYVKPAPAEVLATDQKHDIAVLRASHVSPPATLSLGRPAAAGGRLFVLGYPATGGPLIPTETWGDLENNHMQPAPAELIDPARMIWIAAPVVAHGFSGGPMLDPRNGAVVGIVRGMVDSTRLHAARATLPASGMVIGPGSSSLAALLREEGTDTDALPVSGNDALEAARRATVHVLCLY